MEIFVKGQDRTDPCGETEGESHDQNALQAPETMKTGASSSDSLCGAAHVDTRGGGVRPFRDGEVNPDPPSVQLHTVGSFLCLATKTTTTWFLKALQGREPSSTPLSLTNTLRRPTSFASSLVSK